MPLKPNTYYWFHSPNGETYVEGVTELHEDLPAGKNYNGWVRTDSEGTIEIFRQFGETVRLKDRG